MVKSIQSPKQDFWKSGVEPGHVQWKVGAPPSQESWQAGTDQCSWEDGEAWLQKESQGNLIFQS